MKITHIFFYTMAILVASSCSDYGRILKSKDIDLKFTKAVEYYKSGQCFKAQPIFEELIGLTRGTQRAEEVYYYYAYTHYCVEDYYMANYYFKQFTKTFAQSKYAEECLFMAAICSSRLSPNFSLDQTDTHAAIEEFQLFMDRYPNSERRDTCNVIIGDLRSKLELKAFELARLYVKTEKYRAAITSLEQAIRDYPDSRYREEMMFLMVKAKYLYAMGSVQDKKLERFRSAMDSYLTFAAAYPEGGFLRIAEDFYTKSSKQVERLSEVTSQTTGK